MRRVLRREGSPDNLSEELRADMAWFASRQNSTLRMKEQRVNVLVAAITVSVAAVVAGPKNLAGDWSRFIIWTLDMCLCFGSSARILRARKSSLRCIFAMNYIRVQLANSANGRAMNYHESLRRIEYDPPPYRFFSLATGTLAGGCVFFAMAGYALSENLRISPNLNATLNAIVVVVAAQIFIFSIIFGRNDANSFWNELHQKLDENGGTS